MKRSYFLLIIGIVSVFFVIFQGTYTYSIRESFADQPPRKELLTSSVTNLDLSSENEDRNSSLKPGEMILLGLGLVSIAIWGRKLYVKNASLE